MGFNLIEAGKNVIENIKVEFMKNGSDYTFWGGLVGIGAGTVLACAATRKLDDILDEHKEFMKDLSETKKHMTGEQIEEHKKEIGRALVARWLKTVGSVAKLYALPAAVELASAGLLVKSHQDDKERKAQLASAVALLSTQVKDLRAGIKEKFGEEAEYDISHGIKEIEEVNEETGEVVKVKALSKEKRDYRFIFDATAYEWSPDPWKTKNYLNQMQKLWNAKLRTRADQNGGRGHVFLSEILAEMWPDVKFPKWVYTAGWIFDEQNPVGDNYISFGIDHSEDVMTQRFVRGLEKDVAIVFNCDGDIISLL